MKKIAVPAKTNRQTLQVCFLAALAGLLFGLDMG